MITRVTLTGIDHECDTEALLELGRRFRLAELAVLAGSEEGTPRMPPTTWIRQW